MINQLKQSPRNLSQKHLHRLRLLPVEGFLENQITLRVPTPNGVKEHEDILISPLLDLEQWEKEQTAPHKRVRELELLSPRLEDDPEFEKHSTIPMMVLKSVSNKQGQTSPAMQSEISGAASNAAIIGFGNILGYLFKYGNNLLIQRALGAAFFGLYSVSFSVISLIASIFALGMDNSMVRYIAIYRGKRQANLIRNLTFFCTALVGVTGMLGALLVLILAPAVANLIHKPETAPILLIMAPLIPLVSMQTVWLGGLQGLKEFKKRVFVQRFLVPLVVFLLMIVTIIFFPNILWVAIVTLVGTLFSAITNLYFLFRAVARAGRLGPNKFEVGTWLGFAIPNFLTSIVNTVLDSVDTLLLAFFVPVLAIGQYAAAIKISGFILLPLNSLNIIFIPTIAELYSKGEKQKLAAMFAIVTKWSITLSLPIFIIATLFSVPLLGISGNSFIAAWPLLIALAVGSMVGAVTGSVGYMLLMTGHQKFSLFNSISTVVLNIVLGIILTPRFGAMGTAISTGVALSIINLVRLIEVRLLLKVYPYRWDVLKPLAAGLISVLPTAGLLYLINLVQFSIRISHYSLSIQLFLIPLYLVFYFGLVALFKISPEDKIVVDKLRSKFGRNKKKIEQVQERHKYNDKQSVVSS